MDNKIRELRARFGLTQDELATKVGVRRETIVFLEKGKYNPSLKLAHDIAFTFEMRIEEVFLFTSPSQNRSQNDQRSPSSPSV